MGALKLFISHSSRLDETEASDNPDKNPNLKLLLDVITLIKQEYGDSVEILVDKDEQGLPAGCDWEKHLNEWLAECHAAVILFSKRAIENSNWVKKEATILSWRRELDNGFKFLIPVCIKGQTTPDDLAQDLFGTLRIDKSQCIRDAENAQDILNGIKQAFGSPESLQAEHPETPFEKLAKNIAYLLDESAPEHRLQEAWDKLEEAEKPAWQSHSESKFASALTRVLLRHEKNCVRNLQCIIDKVRPSNIDNAYTLLRFVRCLWVDAGAAALIPASLHSQHPVIAMNGRFLLGNGDSSIPGLFTLDRYIERAWSETELINIISLSRSDNVEVIKEQIREKFGAKSKRFSSEFIDGLINDDPQQILIYLPATENEGGVPDADVLNQLSNTYKKIIIILGTGDTLPKVPQDIIPVLPELKLEEEYKYEITEQRARAFIDKMYRR